jgi:hypothetical protein
LILLGKVVCEISNGCEQIGRAQSIDLIPRPHKNAGLSPAL